MRPFFEEGVMRPKSFTKRI